MSSTKQNNKHTKEDTTEQVYIDGKLIKMPGTKLGWVFVPAKAANVTDVGVSYPIVALPLKKSFAFIKDRIGAIKMATNILEYVPSINTIDTDEFVKALGDLVGWIKHCNKTQQYTPAKEWMAKHFN